jgi:hypothetical protein
MAEHKSEFLVCYDYGMGGLWGVFTAASASEVTNLYPELVVVTYRPKWMTSESLEQLRSNECHDIDEAPWGILSAVLADRDKK